MKRCAWPGSDLMIKYHDEEWGTPCHDDKTHFEYILLDTFQAGLSWAIILNKRENFRKAFDNFNYKKIAKYDEKKIEKLLKDPGIIRNKLKVRATITNARAFMRVQKEFGSFDNYIWQFVGGVSIQNNYKKVEDLPAKTEEAEKMSRDMKARGFKFVGPTVCYAYMQGAGLVNDHTTDCFRHKEIKLLS